MAKNAIPADCKPCPSLHTGGIKQGGYDRWCCRFSGTAPRMIGHCKTTGYHGSAEHRQRIEQSGENKMRLARLKFKNR